LKSIKNILWFILRSHLVVTIAATLLAYQSLLLTGDHDFKNHILLVIFCGTIFVYNLANIIISIPSKEIKKISLLSGNLGFRIIICFLSLTGFLIGFYKTSAPEKIIILIAGIFTIAYEMPFTKNNRRLKGFRNVPVLKNIILAAVWAAATAWLPLTGKTELHSLDLIFICLKRFFFVLPLAMVFDVRDQYNDLKSNVKTIPNQLGINATKNFALLSMVFFIIVVFLHKKSMEAIGSRLLDFSVPLYISAFIASVFIFMINESKKNLYYILIIDGSMILQFILVYVFVLLKQN
jgi:4-hydroxybenzoate polyprenyltransferase